MRPVPIADDLVPPGCRRFVISAPDGDLTNDTIRPVEAVAGQIGDGVAIAVLLELDEGDIERLQETPAVWLTMWTNQIPAFSVEIADGQGHG